MAHRIPPCGAADNRRLTTVFLVFVAATVSERRVDDDIHDEVAVSLAWIAKRREGRDKFDAALRQEVLDIKIKAQLVP
jgi:hypothetical protein